MTPKEPTNYELNQLKEFIDKCCNRCGRKFPETVLSIEGRLKNHEFYHCVETEICEKIRQENLKKIQDETSNKPGADRRPSR